VSGLASKPLGRFSSVWPQNHSDGFRRFGLKTGGGLASKPVATVFGGLASKPAAVVFSGLASNLVATIFFSLASKLVVTVCPGLASKPVVDFSVEPKNQGGGGFPSLGLKTGIFGFVIWASKSPQQFHGLGLKTKWASVCWLRNKTNGGRSVRNYVFLQCFSFL
jgi:hypothetical protein